VANLQDNDDPHHEAITTVWCLVSHESVYCEGGVDYDKLIEQFGCERITETLLERFEAVVRSKGTGKPLHPLLRRGIFYSHKDLDLVLKEFEDGRPFYLYTGRGPSSGSMHLGHLLPFLFTRYLQEAFDVPVVIQLTDDEKYLYKKDLTLEQIGINLIENCKDIIACGFDPKKTFIFSNFGYMGTLYLNVVRIQRLVTNSQVKAIFGVTPSDCIGRTAFPAVQAAPSFVSSFPEVMSQDKNRPGFVRRCLIPCGIVQDPFFRMTRDVAMRLGDNFLKPALIHSKFFPALQGIDKKMSSSDPLSAIFLIDSPKDIKRKIYKHAFSGGRDLKEEHQRLGGNTKVDIAFQYLSFFLEDDDELRRLGEGYAAGTVSSSEMKKRCCQVLCDLVRKHQIARARVSDEVVKEFLRSRPLDL